MIWDCQTLQPHSPDGGHGLDAEEEGAGEGGHVVHAVHVVRRLVRGQVPVRQRHQEPDAGEQQPRDVEGGAETVSHYDVINTVWTVHSTHTASALDHQTKAIQRFAKIL